MSKSLLYKLGAPILALSLVAACGTDDEPDPVEDDAPVEDETPMDDEAPLMEDDEAPLNQDDDADMGGDNNGEDGANNENGGTEDDVLEEPTDIGEDEENEQ